MRRFRFTARQFWITALAAGGAGVAGSFLAASAGIDPMYPGGIAAGAGGAVTFWLQGIKPDPETTQ